MMASVYNSSGCKGTVVQFVKTGGIMNTNQIDYFLKAYRERSYTAAAKLVPMSAQGLTKAIHSLEGELGVPLFENDANGRIKPTPYAEEFKVFSISQLDR